MSNERFGKDDANNPQGSPKGEDELDQTNWSNLEWQSRLILKALRGKISAKEWKAGALARRDVPKKRES